MGLLAEVAGRAIDSRRLIDRMRHDAERDPLTGLRNRRAFTHDLALARDQLAAGESLTLVMFDLDGLKRVNDTVGHPAGDRMLRDVGARLLCQVRSEDGAYRLGGDEFAVLARRTDPRAIVELAERIRAAAERVVKDPAGGAAVRVTASVGVACAPAGDDGMDLVALADSAMYEAKGTGGNRVVVRPAG
jgi:diguanylate cyclase (GGDEF)-like protein